ncbi:MAG: hypothetical protein H7246_04365 [Phycisphaerae bacterium]|nr:hypothetical protein [Saprospiraceae bacterium]
MQSRIFTLFGLICFSLFLSFCAKDEEPIEIEESPFFDFFNENLLNIDTVESAADAWEYGFGFTPLKNGKITKFGIKLPAKGDFSVTLWDLSGPTPVVMLTKEVNSSQMHENALADIPEIALEEGVNYGITVRSNAFYRITKPGNGKFIFPKIIGNIRIDAFREIVNNTGLATFPTMTNDTRVAPCVNVIFIAD